MILINDNWKEIRDLEDVSKIIREYFNEDLADEMEKLIPEHTNEEYYELGTKLEEKESDIVSLKDENLRLKIALTSIVRQFYDYRIKSEEASKYNIPYHDEDEYIECYFHMFESAGERVWKMLGFENEIISETELCDMEEKLRNKLLNLSHNK